MNFMSNILPGIIERWTITDGSLNDNQLLIHAGGSASCSLNKVDIAYIPQAFKFIATHNTPGNWKKPTVFATLHIRYDDGDIANVYIPLSTTGGSGTTYITDNVALVDSKTYEAFDFTIENTLDTDLILTQYELKPSMDLDESMYNSIEGMLPQLAYAYNASNVTAASGVETQIAQLPLAIKQDTNLLMHASITGTSLGGKITCSVKLDGKIVKSFPVAQKAQSGDFYFGIPSLLAFVKSGVHLLTIHITGDTSAITVPKDNALIVVDGKGILGGASGEYPHAEVNQLIPLGAVKKRIVLGVDVTNIEPDTYVIVDTIPAQSFNLNPSVTVTLT